MDTIAKPAPTFAIFCAYAGGLLLAIVPALVELVMGDFILLLPVALLLAIIALWPLRGSTAHAVFACSLVLALMAEVGEQILFAGQVPKWADIAPPALFTISGIALVLTAHRATRH